MGIGKWKIGNAGGGGAWLISSQDTSRLSKNSSSGVILSGAPLREAKGAQSNRAERDSRSQTARRAAPEGAGKMAMAFSRSANRRSRMCAPTSPGRRSIIGRFRFRKNSAGCCSVTRSRSMSGMCGIDSTLSGLIRVGGRFPG